MAASAANTIVVLKEDLLGKSPLLEYGTKTLSVIFNNAVNQWRY
jgi:hypothetical protein